MGNGRFDTTTYRAYSTTHQLDTATRDQVFTQSKIHANLDPKKIKLRESCDSDSNPNSTPIQFYLDVTGSMGFLAERIAKDLLPKIFENLYEMTPVSDPHVAFGAIDDIRVRSHWRESAALQVSQFEAGAIPLIEQLRQIYLVGGGGGNQEESYDLAWYFSTHFTNTDNFDKRGKKGYLFTVGDEPPPALPLTREDIDAVFANKDLPEPISIKSTLSDAEKKWKVFHFIVEQGDFVQRHGIDRVARPWKDLLGPNVILVRNIDNLPEIISATLKIAEGADINEVINSYDNPDVLRHAFSITLDT